MMKEKSKFKIWQIPLIITLFVGMCLVAYGAGGKPKLPPYHKSSFKAEYFIGGLCILIPLYLYIRYMMDEEEGFPLENFHKDIVIQDIKRHKICENIDLTHAVIESYVFGVGKNQNEYANIFYNKSDIEFVKTKITIQYYDKSLPILTAFTNIDKITLKEIFQKHSTIKVYFDKYIPNNYYLDLEFLIELDIMETSQSI